MLDPAKDNDTVVKEFLSKITEKEYGGGYFFIVSPQTYAYI